MPTNHIIVLDNRPEAEPTPSNFKMVTAETPELQEGQVLVKHHFLSLDPYMRGRMSDVKSYATPVQIGEVMVGGTAGEVIKSNHPKFAPGDKVVGYVTRGRGVSIHRGDCPNLLLLAHEPERRLDIDWHEMAGERFVVRLAMEGTDRRGLYADVAAAVSATGTDIKSLELKTTDGKVTGAAMVEVENLAHLERIMKAARRVKGIAAVSRREKITSAV